MRLASYNYDGGQGYGIVGNSGIFDLAKEHGARYPTLRTFLAAGAYRELPQPIRQPDFHLEEVRFLPVIPDAGAIFCVGINYADHARETGRKLPDHPSTFLKLPRSLVGHGESLIRPRVSSRLDWEAELAVVIGRHARHVPESDALSYVAGYTVLNDGSIRDWQLERDVTQGKNFFSSGACGPWMVTADDVPDPSRLVVTSRLNGVEMQRSDTSNLVFDVPKLVSYYSTLTRLEPGDIISTGTPGGVGHRRNPPIFMQPGDVIEVEVSGIGVLRNTIVDE